MSLDKESLQQALLEVEHLRQLEARSRRNAEALLEGLELLSSAQSQADGVQAILAVLSSLLDMTAAVVFAEDPGGEVVALGETDPALRVAISRASDPLARAFRGKPVLLADAAGGAWAGAEVARVFARFGSAALIPVAPVDRPTVIACLSDRRAAYSKAHVERLRYFIPLAAQAIRHSFKLADLRQAIQALDSARRAAERSARTDPLTGRSNRKHLEEYTRKLLRQGTDCTFALVDLNGFKTINDNLGHHAGDHLLIELADRLSRLFDSEVMVARIGGDEFGILSPVHTAREEILDFGWRICGAMTRPVPFGEENLEVGASVGIATGAETEFDAEALFQAADIAMYTVKRRHETNFAIFDPEMRQWARRRFTRDALTKAMNAGEIQPWFQPQVDMRTGRIVGLEVLARWTLSMGRVRAPGEFIPEIEKHGLVEPFTLMILRQALETGRDWMSRGIDVPGLSINLAEASLASSAGTDKLMRMIAEYPEFEGRIVLELTEGVLINRARTAILASIERLVGAGLRLALDDFGTGFASLAHLRAMTFHELKIDQSFVAGIGNDRPMELIIESIVSIAHGFGARAVAEGVEFQPQHDFLRRIGCDVAQGFLYGKPAPADRIAEALVRAAARGRRGVG